MEKAMARLLVLLILSGSLASAVLSSVEAREPPFWGVDPQGRQICVGSLGLDPWDQVRPYMLANPAPRVVAGLRLLGVDP